MIVFLVLKPRKIEEMAIYSLQFPSFSRPVAPVFEVTGGDYGLYLRQCLSF